MALRDEAIGKLVSAREDKPVDVVNDSSIPELVKLTRFRSKYRRAFAQRAVALVAKQIAAAIKYTRFLTPASLSSLQATLVLYDQCDSKHCDDFARRLVEVRFFFRVLVEYLSPCCSAVLCT